MMTELRFKGPLHNLKGLADTASEDHFTNTYMTDLYVTENGKPSIIAHSINKAQLVDIRAYLRAKPVNDSYVNELTKEELALPLFQDWFKAIDKRYKVFFPHLTQPPINSLYYFNNIQKSYHFDKIPKAGTMSTILTLREKCYGGKLSIPSYNIGLMQEDGDLVMFDGQRLKHGATEIKLEEGGYRLSIVFYHHS